MKQADDIRAPHHQEDLAFAARVMAGEREAAELLLYRCQIWTGQLARLKGVPAQEWGELANEALVTALGQMRRGLFRGECSFQTWMETIIRGKVADYWRAHGKQQTLVPLEAPLAETDDDTAKAISLIQTLATQTIDHELRLSVLQALRALPRQHAMILILNEREGYSTTELSRLLALPQGTIGRKLAEAKKLFRRAVCELGIVGNAPGMAGNGSSTARQEDAAEWQAAERRDASTGFLWSKILSWLIPTRLIPARRWRGHAVASRLNFTRL